MSPVAASHRGNRAPKAAGTARPAISSPSGTTEPGPPAAKLSAHSARTSGAEAGTAGWASAQLTTPEMARNAAASAPPANAIDAPGGADPQVAQPGRGGRRVDRQRHCGRELEERADLDRVLMAVEVGEDARARVERRGERCPGHGGAGDQARQEQRRRDRGKPGEWRAAGELAVHRAEWCF